MLGTLPEDRVAAFRERREVGVPDFVAVQVGGEHHHAFGFHLLEAGVDCVCEGFEISHFAFLQGEKSPPAAAGGPFW